MGACPDKRYAPDGHARPNSSRVPRDPPCVAPFPAELAARENLHARVSQRGR